jgi:hypothetical protein
VAARDKLYGAHMSSDHEAEIRASVGAHHDLGSGYDDAVAEGLVQRIGEEIDKRIDARLGQVEQQWAPPHRVPGYQAPGHRVPGNQAPGNPVPQPEYQPLGYRAPPGHQPPPGYQAPPAYYQAPPAYYQPPAPAPPTPIPPWPAHRSVAATFIALGSMAMGVAATAVVAHASNPEPGAQAIMVLLIWTAIAVINIAYARRR